MPALAGKNRRIVADERPQDLAARVVAWHNRHPLAERITLQQVHAMGWVALLTGSARHSVLALLVLFALGAILLRFVDVEAGRGLRKGL